MTSTSSAAVQNAATPGVGLPFPVASRPQHRYSNVQTVSNAAGAGSFQVVQLAATGWVRRIHLLFQATMAGALTGSWASDGPFNLISAITLTDATGQPIFQPISGFNLYLTNKYMGIPETRKTDYSGCDPRLSPEFATAAAAGTVATFRLTLDLEMDSSTGYGCIPNLDSNASLQLKVDYANASVSGLSGFTTSTLAMRVEQEYWAPVGNTLGGVPVNNEPPGAGDFREIRYETQTVSPSAENLVSLTNRGGFLQGVVLISRAAGVRTAFTPGANVGYLLDNQPIDEGIPLESHNDTVRRALGFNGTDVASTSANPTAGQVSGLDVGVVAIPFWALAGGRQSWLNTRAGSLWQVKITPGASASTLEVVTGLMQVKHADAFFGGGMG